MPTRTHRGELAELRERVAELEETLRAITAGEVDALVVQGPDGPRVYTLEEARDFYRVFVEVMPEGAAAVSDDGTIVFANRGLADMLGLELDKVFGSSFESLVREDDRALTRRMLEDPSIRRREVRLVDSTGCDVPAYVSSSRLPSVGAASVCLVCTDLRALKVAEVELRRSQAYTRSLIEASLDPFMTLDSAGTITDVNEQMERLTAAPRGELIGTAFRDFATDPARADEGVRLVLTAGSVTDYELTVRARDGGETEVAFNATIYAGEGSGGPRGIFAAARDVTQRNQAAALLRLRARQQQAVVELGMLALTSETVAPLLRAAVVAVARTLDVEYAKVLELRPDGGLVVADAVGFDPVFVGSSVPRGRESEAEYVLVAHGPVVTDDLGAETRFEMPSLLVDSGVVSAARVRIGAVDAPFGVLGADTARRRHFSEEDIRFLQAMANVLGAALLRVRAEQGIRDLNDALELRVGQRTAELAASNRELEAFAFSVSHDLRAPLRAIDGFSQILLERDAERLDEEGRHRLARVRAGAQRMGVMIDDLLQLSRVTRAELRREPVDISGIARDVADELRRDEPARVVEVAIADGITAVGDPVLLRIVIENLLANAWKFTAGRERARVEVGATEHAGPPGVFVRDDGAGFDMAYVGQLFTPFQRLHHADEFPGTGIGLATVSRIVTRHGGRIWAQAEPGRGATFTFTLDANGGPE